MRSAVVWAILAILFALGLPLFGLAIADAYMLTKGLLTGVLTRPVLMGPPEMLQISRYTDPDRFWRNEGFWAFLGLIAAFIAAPLLAPLSIKVLGKLTRPKISSSP